MAEETERLEASLIEFVKAAWPHFDSSLYVDHWVLHAICEHLQAVVDGDVRYLLLTIPPRCSKTNIVSVCFPAWVWARRNKAFLSGAGVRFLCGSYNDDLSLTNANLSRRLIESAWYQERWGDRFDLRPDQNTKHHFDTSVGGGRFSSSVGGTLIGKGYDCAIIDDPHNTGKRAVESDADRRTVQNWLREILGTRKNNAKLSAVILVMQRMHMEDAAGYVLSGENAKQWTNFMVPMRHDVKRHCVTVLKRDAKGKVAKAWQDPRKADGELMWPERFGDKEIKEAETELGPAMASGRLQQNPEPAGGSIFKRSWWKPWLEPRYPDCSYVLASLDTAFTEKKENDPSAFTIWGVFGTGAPKAILLYAWEGRLELHELVKKVAYHCRKIKDKSDTFRVDKLVIEQEGAGHSVEQELTRLYGNLNAFDIELVPVRKWGDKVARAMAVQPMFAADMIYCPMSKTPGGNTEPKSWAKPVVDQMAVFPHDKHDDLTDSATAGLRYLRIMGYLERAEEYADRATDEMTHRNRVQMPYQI